MVDAFHDSWSIHFITAKSPMSSKSRLAGLKESHTLPCKPNSLLELLSESVYSISASEELAQTE